jgi:hypothetical protein
VLLGFPADLVSIARCTESLSRIGSPLFGDPIVSPEDRWKSEFPRARNTPKTWWNDAISASALDVTRAMKEDLKAAISHEGHLELLYLSHKLLSSDKLSGPWTVVPFSDGPEQDAGRSDQLNVDCPLNEEARDTRIGHWTLPRNNILNLN